MNLVPGKAITVTIDRVAYGGDGVALPDGFTLFVPRTAPGDQVDVEITDVRRRYGRAVIRAIQSESKDRVVPRCKHFSECGGCHLQHLSPKAAAEQKGQFVRDALTRLASLEKPEVSPLITGDITWNYRNRVTYHRSESGAQGYVSWRRDQVIDVPQCPIANEQLNRLWGTVRSLAAEIPAFQLPYIVLRRTTTGQTSIIFSVTTPIDDTLKNISSQLEVTSAYSTLIRKDSYSPFGKEFVSLCGPDTLVEELGGIQYHVRPDLFFQINPEMTEKIVADVTRWARKQNVTRALDIFCGAGLFTLALARQNISTLGIDVQYPSIQQAERSAKENQLHELAKFRAGKADRIVQRLFAEGEQFDTAVVDPPRKGLLPGIIETIPKLGIKQLLYVSCSPATFARDVKALAPLGFKLISTQPYDMFPQTYHVELVGTFEKT